MKRYVDAEKNEIHIGDHVAVWDNYFKKMCRCEVIKFKPQKVEIKPIHPDIGNYIAKLKYPSDLLIIKK